MRIANTQTHPSLFEAHNVEADPLKTVRIESGANKTHETPARVIDDLPLPKRGVTTAYVYVRHRSGCPKSKDKYNRNCGCCKWIYSRHRGEDDRFSANSRVWAKAEKIRQQLEDSFDPDKAELKLLRDGARAKCVVISDAIESYLADVVVRNLSRSTLRKCQLIFLRRLLPWCEQNGLQYLNQITVSQLTRWRSLVWGSLAPTTAKSDQQRVIHFFNFCVLQEWLERNPARRLTPIKVKQEPTGYFNREEFETLVRATYRMNKEKRSLVLTLLLLMRWSGLRIGDAVTLERSRLVDDHIVPYTTKTGMPVRILLPTGVAQALRDIPQTNLKYFFWNGISSRTSVAGLWGNGLRKLFKLAHLRNDDGSPKQCKSRMLRNTFAVEAILSGMPIDQVAASLGHRSTRTTEGYYLPWVRARQEQLEQAFKKMHAADSITKSVTRVENLSDGQLPLIPNITTP